MFSGSKKSKFSSTEESQLDDLFKAFRESCDASPESPTFMPHIWARIEARRNSTNWFDSMAKALVTAAIAASAILGFLISSSNQSTAFYKAPFVDALVTDHAISLEPLHLDRLSELQAKR
jgi:hypothetical protein